MQQGYLGIDVGTQGLSVVLVDTLGTMVASGDGHYEMVPDLETGCYEQNPADWERALKDAMDDLREKNDSLKNMQVLGIGISGQMHGEVLIDESGNSLGTARLWCDSRNEAEGVELTERFGVKIPKRMTVARWLWTLRHQPDKVSRTHGITTPGGWLAYRLSGERNLGIGDASGMFPIDHATLDYDQRLLERFYQLFHPTERNPLHSLLPKVCRAGEDGGRLNATGSQILSLPVGIPVAPAEGDQPASLAGSMIGSAGMVAVSFGTSVCANSIGDRPFHGVDCAIDHFCAPDGKPINMVFLRNGTTFMNSLVDMFAVPGSMSRGDLMDQIMGEVLRAPVDCSGVQAIPFIDDEPGLGVAFGGKGALHELHGKNLTAGNVIKAALLATMFNLKLGVEVLDRQGYPRRELFLSGGLAKTPETGQILADVMQTPVTVSTEAAEGCAYGAALLAKYRVESIQQQSSVDTWEQFLQSHSKQASRRFEPDSQRGTGYHEVFQSYQRLLQTVLAP
jgi:sugar (pentulose or hexulose) kinase